MTASRLLPTRAQWVDIGFVAALVLLGLVGFQSVYGGYEYLIAGTAGLVIGLVVAHAGTAFKLPALAVVAITMVSLVLLSGISALRSTALVGVVPTLETIIGLADGGIHGWRQLLTIGQPVGNSGNLLAVPYLLGVLGGSVGLTVAERTKRVMPVLVVPVAVLAVSILFGTAQPAALLLQGVAFAAVALAYVSVRHGRLRPVVAGSQVGPAKAAVAAGILAVAAFGGLLLAPALPMADANDRVVLRDMVEPPFDPRSYPSPLLAVRGYANLAEDAEVMRVNGLPDGGRIRLAALDTYDGVVWGVAGGGGELSPVSGYFARVGERVEADLAGTESTLSVTLGKAFPSQPWLPSAGETTAVRFAGDEDEQLQGSLRYNAASDTAAVPALLKPGTEYEVDVVLAPSLDPASRAEALAASRVEQLGLPAPPQEVVPEQVDTLTQSLMAGAEGDAARVQAITDGLRQQGFYSDGEEGTYSPPGHFAGRLATMMVEPTRLVGNAEQYAALAAIMLHSAGYPARVVVGFQPDPAREGAVMGKDHTAWVEVPFSGVGWVPFDVTPPEDQRLREEIRQAAAPQENPQQSETPPLDLTPPNQSSIADAAADSRPDEAEQGDGWLDAVTAVLKVVATVAIPLLVLLSPFAAVLAAKMRRRRRRRNTGRPVDRISGGWSEVLDLAVDRGATLPGSATRSEAARGLPVSGAPALATTADRAVFGPEDPDDEAAEQFWAEVDEALTGSYRSMSRPRRIWTKVNPASLFGGFKSAASRRHAPADEPRPDNGPGAGQQG